MACCIFTAYFMNRMIKACEVLNLNLIESHYNKFHDGPSDLDQETAGSDVVVSRISIDGMTCAACTTAIETAITALKGVQRVTVSLPLGRATIVHHSNQPTQHDLVATAENAGYRAKSGEPTAAENLQMTQQTLQLAKLKAALSSAMTLSSIVASLDWLGSISCLQSYRHVFQTATMILGVYIQLISASFIHKSAFSKTLTAPTMDTLISLSLLLGLALSFFNISLFGLDTAQTYFSSGSFLALVIIGGRYLDHLLRRQSAANLSGLYRLQIESSMARVRARAPSFITTTSSSSSTTSYSLSHPTPTTLIPCALLRPSDEIIIPPSTIIPTDSYIISGHSIIDTSTMTGESLPRKVGPGDFLMSGTRNLSYELVAVVATEQSQSALEMLVESIAGATESLSPSIDSDATTGSQEDYLLQNFVPSILALTLLSFMATLFFSPAHLTLPLKINIAASRAITVLASACPCALGLAAPSAVMAAVDVAFMRGIIVKDGLGTLKKVRALGRGGRLVCDKTGTLTRGELTVVRVEGDVSVGSIEENTGAVAGSGVGVGSGVVEAWQALLIAAAEKEEARRHPVAKAVWNWAFQMMDENTRVLLSAVDVKEYNSELGKGVSCSARIPRFRVDENEGVAETGGGNRAAERDMWHTIHIGTATFLAEHGIPLPNFPSRSTSHIAHRATVDEATTVHISLDLTHLTTLTLQDTLRDNAASVISTLKARYGMEITMLTGDVSAEAKRVSRELGIEVLSSRALPGEKADMVRKLKGTQGKGREVSEGNTTGKPRDRPMVAMLGDGLNDAAALAAADIGIYLSPDLVNTTANGGSIQDSTSTITLTSPNLSRLIDLLIIAQKTVNAARYMRLWAVWYNVVTVALALGLGERWGVRIDANVAGMMMAGSSVVVVGSALQFFLVYPVPYSDKVIPVGTPVAAHAIIEVDLSTSRVCRAIASYRPT
ncbi:putative copper-transporting ATPase PacS [Cyphellophora attinorum]|uniref:Putative copper-transporting ATPase PacS n=1 Tax=Cyphellophora attinorum TaxID=1664694 RepID=A0A0N1HI59_9EURO|nr:putative copper-transporting ATPase PacS [Phialophora attinorum]KPI35685.1 putative copper-transporting ATPase PacS [Phialophora attinorum]